MPFNIGDNVRMSQAGRARWRDSPNNPWDFTGFVTRLQSYGRRYVVLWPSTIINGYDEEHLELATAQRDIADLLIDNFDFLSVAAYRRLSNSASLLDASLEGLKSLARNIIHDVVNRTDDPISMIAGGFLVIKQNGKVYLTFAPFSITEGVDMAPAIPRDSGIRKLDLDD